MNCAKCGLDENGNSQPMQRTKRVVDAQHEYNVYTCPKCGHKDYTKGRIKKAGGGDIGLFQRQLKFE